MSTSRPPASPSASPSGSSTAPEAPAAAQSTAARALEAAGDAQSAQDVSALDDAAAGAQARLGRSGRSLVERLIYGPLPKTKELASGYRVTQDANRERAQGVVDAAVGCLARGQGFAADGKLSATLREEVAKAGGYGYTVPVEFGGQGGTYPELALAEEEMAANGLGALAVEISGELTIGAGSLLAYGTAEQKSTFLPLIAEGQLMAFGLTEVGIGVNAKKVRAYVEEDPATGDYRLFAHGDRNKLWITNATHGALVALVARIGETGKRVGLFVTRLPEKDIGEGETDHTFWCKPSNADAFTPNHNSRIHLYNFPIPKENRIEADGVEVLFYCLRMGRCMLAAMSAGYQRMFAKDAANYACQREGVGGLIIKHELPRLALGKMLGGALQSRALSHLSLQQDADGVDLAGLRDLTKSAAATTAMESLIACERVLGGRTFTKGSRANDARGNVHVFGVVEGEDDLILMGMVKDVTAAFTEKYMAPMLSVIQSINMGDDGKPLPREQRILRILPSTLVSAPGKALQATGRLLGQAGFWKLKGWILGQGLLELLRLPGRLIPTSWLPRFRKLPKVLRGHARYAERKLRGRRWTYLWVNLFFQLELTRAQIPLQRYGKSIEHLVSMLALCHHSQGDPSQVQVAALQCALIKDKFRAIRIVSGLFEMQRTRALLDTIGKDIEAGRSTLINNVEAEPFTHSWLEA